MPRKWKISARFTHLRVRMKRVQNSLAFVVVIGQKYTYEMHTETLFGALSFRVCLSEITLCVVFACFIGHRGT